MTLRIYPVPDLASVGMVSDIDATQSGISAFTIASNVRFQDGRISRGPVFSEYAKLTTNPRAFLHFTDELGSDHFVVKDEGGFLYEKLPNGGASNVSPPGYAGSNSQQPVTSCLLANVSYINRPDGSPAYRATASSAAYASLSNYDSGWRDSAQGSKTFNLPASVRFQAIRSYNSRLIGLGVTQGPLTAPNGVWWSEVADSAGKPPRNWANDPAGSQISTQSTGGYTNLADMRGSIIDGCALGGSMLIFSDQECWRMDPSGEGKFIFSFTRVFGSGIINTNCIAEVEGRLYCFGSKDIFVTDSSPPQSIAAGRIRDFVYTNISNTNRSQSFVFHNPMLKEVYFCFASNDPNAAFPLRGGIGCNRAAVFNYAAQTWYLYDLPYCTCASLINTFTGPTFQQLIDSGVTYAQMVGSHSSMLDGATDIVALGSNASTAPMASDAAIRTFSLYDGIAPSSKIDRWATAPVLMIKAPMDGGELSQIPAVAARLTDTKHIASLYVKGTLNSDAAPVYIYVGTSDTQSASPTYNDFDMTWTPAFSKLDYNLSGRFIGLKLVYNDYRDFSLDGIDLELQVLGTRSS